MIYRDPSRTAGVRIIKTLRHLAEASEGDHRPDCPIIEQLGSGKTSNPAIEGDKPAKRPRRSAALSC